MTPGKASTSTPDVTLVVAPTLAQALGIVGAALAELALAIAIARSVEQIAQGIPAMLAGFHVAMHGHLHGASHNLISSGSIRAMNI